METLEFDIAIIGAGAAGLRAAIEVCESNPNLSVALISKVYPVRSHTVCAEGGVACALRDYDSHEKHARDTVVGGDFLCDQDAVEFFVKQAPEEIVQLEHFGCPFSREEDGSLAMRAFGGMSEKRTAFAADKTGFYILHTLFEQSLKYEKLKRFDEFFVTSLLRNENKITGCIAIDMRGGKMVSFKSKAVILATGGAGKMYSFSSNSTINTGDGMALAFSAGLPLKDMELIQFHPTALPGRGILITESARGEGGYLINKNGERFMEKYSQKLELAPRDIVCRAINNEIKIGNGFDGPNGKHVKLDIRHLGEELIDERLPFVRELAQEFAGIDPVNEPIPVMPVCHYFMGGIATNVRTETEVGGLFAAGENACVSIHGANRLGSNSLAECLVFGKVAGEEAAKYASKNTFAEFNKKAAQEAEESVKQALNQNGGENLSDLRESMQLTMNESAWIERDKASLEKGMNEIIKLKERAEKVKITDHSLAFNTELTSLFELKNMLLLAEAVLQSALHREESRGSHFRKDHTSQTGAPKHTLIRKNLSGMIIEEKPVTITKWHPKESK